MKAHELKTNKNQSGKRVGRGISAGGGKTAGRGTKGQNSRSGGGTRLGFEGGQNPLVSRIPKLPGFRSRRIASHTVTLTQLNSIKKTVVDNSLLKELRITSKINQPVRVVATGEIKSKKTVKLQGASKVAIAAIEKAGGSFKLTDAPRRAHKQPKEQKSS